MSAEKRRQTPKVCQTTIARQVTCQGVGLHSGQSVVLTIRPAASDTGIRFRRTDLGVEIPATVQEVSGVQYALVLGRRGVTVETSEHLLAALAASGIDNAVIELNAREVPIMDGSSAPFVRLLAQAGTTSFAVSRRYMKVLKPVQIATGDKRIAIYPSDAFKVSYTISFDHPLLQHQSRTERITAASFVDDIAPARTFGFEKEVEWLKANGLALGGTADNAIVIGDTTVLTTLRFEDEFVRHKILDAVGDLSLVGHPILGHIVAHRAGHALHTQLAAELLADQDAWVLVEVDAVDEIPPAPNLVETIDVTPQILSWLRQDLGRLHQLSAEQFEQLLCDRLDKMGFGVKLVGGSTFAPDGGIDIVAWPKKTSFPFLLAVQAKHHFHASRKTGPSQVKEFHSAVASNRFHAGMLVTSTSFTPQAKWFADNKQQLVRLRDFGDLSRWIFDNFLSEEEWREIPKRIELASGVFVDLSGVSKPMDS